MVDSIETKAKKTGNDGLMIYIPKALSGDSQNPISPGDKIKITVNNQKMVIEKIE